MKLVSLRILSNNNAFVRLEHCFQTARTMLLNGWSNAFEQPEQCFRTTKAMLQTAWSYAPDRKDVCSLAPKALLFKGKQLVSNSGYTHICFR